MTLARHHRRQRRDCVAAGIRVGVRPGVAAGLEVIDEAEGDDRPGLEGAQVVFEFPAFCERHPELVGPGLKVLHVPDVDFETTCLTFVRWRRRRMLAKRISSRSLL